ncbi:hypothetical protein H072_281 [Dactylellina haptotyla CBS 200.50]|uniref:Ecp2 effector protein domain-containing protein n=1 Tax=Dactylellina haptotyla (strain CBS 200.50) TaxID=1284197 RepID=S8CDJ0_DACHA|nr:hypothetical protein H072_281 [Dactylellina haptotyla CBS 200.50]
MLSSHLSFLIPFTAFISLSSAWDTIAMDEYPTSDCTGQMLYTHWPSVTDCIDVDYATNSLWINTGSGYFAGVPVAHAAGRCPGTHRIGRMPGLNDTGGCVDINTMFPEKWGGRIRSVLFQ